MGEILSGPGGLEAFREHRVRRIFPVLVGGGIKGIVGKEEAEDVERLGNLGLEANREAKPQSPRVIHKQDHQGNFVWEENWKGRNYGKQLLQGTNMFGHRWRMRVVVLLCGERSAPWFSVMVVEHFFIAYTKRWWEAGVGQAPQRRNVEHDQL